MSICSKIYFAKKLFRHEARSFLASIHGWRTHVIGASIDVQATWAATEFGTRSVGILLVVVAVAVGERWLLLLLNSSLSSSEIVANANAIASERSSDWDEGHDDRDGDALHALRVILVPFIDDFAIFRDLEDTLDREFESRTDEPRRSSVVVLEWRDRERGTLWVEAPRWSTEDLVWRERDLGLTEEEEEDDPFLRPRRGMVGLLSSQFLFRRRWLLPSARGALLPLEQLEDKRTGISWCTSLLQVQMFNLTEHEVLYASKHIISRWWWWSIRRTTGAHRLILATSKFSMLAWDTVSIDRSRGTVVDVSWRYKW